MPTYRITYSDSRSCEEVLMENDGKTLTTTLRGVSFSGEDFDSLSPAEGTKKELLSQFDLNQECLCQCKLVVKIPTTVIKSNESSIVILEATIELGPPSGNGSLEFESVFLRLVQSDGTIVSSGTGGWFEDEMLEIQSKLPEDTYLRNCIGCAYSDYSPYGHGLFGDMLCFRNLKEEYLAVKGKDDFWGILNRYDRFVQETHECKEFAQRPANTGYRG